MRAASTASSGTTASKNSRPPSAPSTTSFEVASRTVPVSSWPLRRRSVTRLPFCAARTDWTVSLADTATSWASAGEASARQARMTGRVRIEWSSFVGGYTYLMAIKPKSSGLKRAAPKKRPRKAKPGSRGLAPQESVVEDLNSFERETQDRISREGGVVLAAYRDPLGRNALLFAVLPTAKVQPTPCEREASSR